jgi:hypothetical protein
LFVLARVRGAGQRGVLSASSADLLPAGRGGVGLERLRRRRSRISLFEHSLCYSGCPQQDSFCLAGRGGEEVKAGKLVATGLGGGSLELLEILLPAALPLRWRAAAIAICGHKVGRVALQCFIIVIFGDTLYHDVKDDNVRIMCVSLVSVSMNC